MRKRFIASACFFVIAVSFFSRAFTVGDDFEAVKFCLGMASASGLMSVIYFFFAFCASVFDA